MLVTQTLEGLYTLRLPAMAEGVKEQAENPEYHALSFDERLGMLVTKELTERENRRLARYKKQAKLRTDAVIEDVDFRAPRGLDRHQVLTLAECTWVTHHQMVAIVGPTGLGKTFLACALANAAIRKGYSALYLRAPRMLDELAVARVDGRFQRLSAAWARVEVLLIDDLDTAPQPRSGSGRLRGDRRALRAARDDPYQSAARRPLARGPRRADDRRRALGPGLPSAHPHRARRRVP